MSIIFVAGQDSHSINQTHDGQNPPVDFPEETLVSRIINNDSLTSLKNGKGLVNVVCTTLEELDCIGVVHRKGLAVRRFTIHRSDVRHLVRLACKGLSV